MGSGNVTTRGHDAPVVSADDHWNIAQLRPVAVGERVGPFAPALNGPESAE